MTEEELQEIADSYGLYTEQDVKNRVSCELLSIGTRNEELETENAELKDKLKNLESVAKVRLANWQKYEEENKELKEQIEKMKNCHNCRKFHNLSYDCTSAEVCNEWEIKEK